MFPPGQQEEEGVEGATVDARDPRESAAAPRAASVGVLEWAPWPFGRGEA